MGKVRNKKKDQDVKIVRDMDRISRIVLTGALIFLAEFHMLWCLLHSFVWKAPYQRFERWFTLILLIVFFFWLLLQYRYDRRSVSRRLRSMLTFEQVFLAGLVLWFAIDCFLHQSMSGEKFLKHNDWRMFTTAIAAFVYFPFVRYLGGRRAREVIEWMIHVIAVIDGIFCAWVLWNYLHSNYITFPSGKQLILDVTWHMSLKLGVNQNITAAQATVMLSLCIYMIITQRKWVKAVYALLAAVFTMIVILSNSRTSFISALCMIIAAVSVFGWRLLRSGKETLHKSAPTEADAKKETQNKAKGIDSRRIRQIVCIIIVLVFCFFFMNWARKALFVLLQYGTNANSTDTIDTQNAVRSFRNINGRDKIWAAAITMMFSSAKNFFLGVMPNRVGQTMVDMGLLTKVQPHCHNAVLQVGASLGVPTMLFFTAFLISLIRRAIRIIRIRDDKRYEHAWAIVIVLFGILIIDLVESFLVGRYTINLPVFSLFAGWLVAVDKSYTKASEKNRKNDSGKVDDSIIVHSKVIL